MTKMPYRAILLIIMASTFIYPSFYEMKATLGIFDSHIEVNEVALRCLGNAVLARSKSGEPTKSIVEAMARSVGINVHADAFGDISVRMSQLYVLSVYQLWERFLKCFKGEHQPFCDVTWAAKNPKERWLGYAIRNVSEPVSAMKVVGPLNVEIVEYYRLIRNCFMHNDSRARRIADRAFLRLNKRSHVIKTQYNTRSSPSRFDHLNVDDFFLFTKSVKEVAVRLCELGRPSDQQIANLISEDRFKRHNGTRLVNALQRVAQTRYGLVLGESDGIINEALKKYEVR